MNFVSVWLIDCAWLLEFLDLFSTHWILKSVKTLHSGNNYFAMELPTSLKYCTKLLVLDVGENNLFGSIPS